MNNIFGFWNEQRAMSTMQRQQAEIVRLRKRQEVGDTIVLVTVVVVALLAAWGYIK